MFALAVVLIFMALSERDRRKITRLRQKVAALEARCVVLCARLNNKGRNL